MDGILNIYKEKGFTSHDVVAKLRGIVGQKKIGHTGTLDPEAEGVLPVCLGKATKLCELLTDKKKTYQAVMLLGQITDTQDATGTVLESRIVEATEQQVRETVSGFQGDYDQIPPMYSALKVNGKKLYELAREGKTIEREARRVQIFGISIDKIELPRVTMTVTCSKGTYIRTLCHDIGEKLGCGACMESLLRTQVSCFELKDSLKLSEIWSLREKNMLETVIFPVDAVFLEYPRAGVTENGEKRLKNGNPMAETMLVFQEGKPENRRIRVYDRNNVFCAVYEYREDKGQYLPVKMFL